ncbi:MAG: Ig-like domain-containing protein [Gordonibacter sp.]|uniref:Ig-like domain-containing protein n=1 Tax=Gordonibacter sp. TaxID=1968902 RepID=UPI002FC5AEA4
MIAPQQVEVGKPITFSGYAEDFGKQIVSVQFSLDNGENWTTYDVSDSACELSVQWTFTYTPETPGSYCLLVRSINSDGRASPEADLAEFTAS